MDHCIKLLVSLALISYTTTARSQYGPYDHKFDEKTLKNKGAWHDIKSWDWHHHSNHPDKDFGYFPSHDREDSSDSSSDFSAGYDDELWIAYHPVHWTHDQWMQPNQGHPNLRPDNNFQNQRPNPLSTSQDPQNWGQVGPWMQPNQGRPGFNNARPIGNLQNVPTTQPTVENPATRSTIAMLQCLRRCPVTSEHNPVCGTNNVTYSNPGRLQCAKFCGTDVTLARPVACIVPTAPPTTATNANPLQTLTTLFFTIFPPTTPSTPVKTTRFTTIDANIPTARPTIPQNILDQVFTSPPPEGDVDGEYDIDIRTKQSQARKPYVSAP